MAKEQPDGSMLRTWKWESSKHQEAAKQAKLVPRKKKKKSKKLEKLRILQKVRKQGGGVAPVSIDQGLTPGKGSPTIERLKELARIKEEQSLTEKEYARLKEEQLPEVFHMLSGVHSTTGTGAQSVAEQLKELKRMKDCGLLSSEEFTLFAEKVLATATPNAVRGW